MEYSLVAWSLLKVVLKIDGFEILFKHVFNKKLC